MKIKSSPDILLSGLFIVSLFASCKKSDPGGTPPPSDVCAGKTITVNATPAGTSGCSNDGSITVSASGSSNFSYKLNSGGIYQASGSFTGLATGSYTVFAKDGDGCEKSMAVTVSSAATEGPLFTAVKNLMATRCQSCHNNAVQNGGQNWTVDCNIVANKTRIKVRAVDEGTMPAGGPPLSQTEKDIITNWINAGGKLGD